MHLYIGKDKKLPYSIGCVSLNFTPALQRIFLLNFMNGSSLRELTKNIHETINSIQWVLKYIPSFKDIGGSLKSAGQDTCTIETNAKITCWRRDQLKCVGKSLLGVTLVDLKINNVFRLIYKYTHGLMVIFCGSQLNGFPHTLNLSINCMRSGKLPGTGSGTQHFPFTESSREEDKLPEGTLLRTFAKDFIWEGFW